VGLAGNQLRDERRAGAAEYDERRKQMNEGQRIELGREAATIKFFKDDTLVGTLFLGPPMRFEGDADESARAFFDLVINVYCKREEAS